MTIDLKINKARLTKLCQRYGVSRLEIFGSASRPDFNPGQSDLDFLVNFDRNASALGAFDRYFGLKEELEELFQRPVDLIEEEAIQNPYFRRAVEQDKVLVYGPES